MSEQQSGANKDQSGKWARLALMTGAVSAYLIYELLAPGEAPRQTVLIMEYVFLAGMLIGLGYSVTMLIAPK